MESDKAVLLAGPTGRLPCEGGRESLRLSMLTFSPMACPIFDPSLKQFVIQFISPYEYR